MPAEPTLIYRDHEIGCFLVQDLAVYRDVGTETPSDASWRRYLRAITRSMGSVERTLIMPRPAGLSARQREEVRGVIGSRPTAVVTASLANRCIITSLSWFRMPIHAFAPGSYREALAWLGCEPLLPAVMRGLELYPPTSPLRRDEPGAGKSTPSP